MLIASKADPIKNYFPALFLYEVGVYLILSAKFTYNKNLYFSLCTLRLSLIQSLSLIKNQTACRKDTDSKSFIL